MAVPETPESRTPSAASVSANSNGSSPGPLRQLRLSSLSPDVHQMDRRKSSKPNTEKRKRHYSKQIHARHPTHDAGFGFDINFPVSGTKTCDTAGHIDTGLKDSSQMATIFLTAAKSVKSKYNVVDAIPSTDTAQHLKSPTGIPIHISQAVRRRADIVKSTFELNSAWLQRFADYADSDDQPLHPGFDRCYNPLQVLRNRATRRKLNHPMPPPPQNPLPCDAFSSHQTSGGKTWKMLWGIDLNEIISDYAWRKTYWAELRNAKGELWFPDSATAVKTPPKHRRISQKLHDKLWNESEKDKTHDESFLLDIPFQPRAKESGPKGLKNNWKEKAKRLYGYQSSSAVELLPLGSMNHASSKSLDGISAVKIARVAGRSPSADDTDQSYQFKFARSGDLDLFLNEDLSKIDVANDGVLSPPHIIVGEGNSSNKRSNSDILEEDSVDDAEKRGDIDNINDVFFSSAHSKQPSVPHLERSPVNRSTSSVEAGPSHSSVLDDVRLDAVGNSVKYLSVVSFLNTNFLESVYPVLLNSTISKLDTLLNEEMNRLLRSINRANCVVIPGRESLYRGFIEEAKSITHLANDHCAVKIDNLLSATDRSYGELNTSLIMELRKTNEKLDKLDRSLFSGVIRSSATIDERSQNYDLADHKFLYIALENAIVVFLRLVWIGVNIVKPVFVFVKFLWKLVMLIFQ